MENFNPSNIVTNRITIYARRRRVSKFLENEPLLFHSLGFPVSPPDESDRRTYVQTFKTIGFHHNELIHQISAHTGWKIENDWIDTNNTQGTIICENGNLEDEVELELAFSCENCRKLFGLSHLKAVPVKGAKHLCYWSCRECILENRVPDLQ